MLWVDGRLVPGDQPVVRADDSAFTEGRGCFTSVRIQDGRPRFLERHVLRLQNAARALRLGDLDPSFVRRSLAELAERAIPGGEGVVRLQVSGGDDGRCHLVGVPRGLGADHPHWKALTSPLRHVGLSLPGGHKLTSRLVLGLAGELARAAGADEALLLDRDDQLVEGARSNIVVVAKNGAPATPAEDRGAVAGIALQVAAEHCPEIQRCQIARAELGSAREIVALNSVRGARPVTDLDGRPVAGGEAGPWAARLAEVLGLG